MLTNSKLAGQFNHPEKLLDATLAAEEKVLEGAEKTQFLAFMRRMLQWRPEDRASAKDLMEDPWLS